VGALVALNSDTGEVLTQVCTGTLIDGSRTTDDVFLTAAHCVVGIEALFSDIFGVPVELVVTFNDDNIGDGPFFYGVIHSHPSFAVRGIADQFDFDVAVILLEDTALTRANSGSCRRPAFSTK
jgi:hypothetical protein